MLFFTRLLGIVSAWLCCVQGTALPCPRGAFMDKVEGIGNVYCSAGIFPFISNKKSEFCCLRCRHPCRMKGLRDGRKEGWIMERWREGGMEERDMEAAFVNASCPLASPHCKDNRDGGGRGDWGEDRGWSRKGRGRENDVGRLQPPRTLSPKTHPTKPAKPTQTTLPGKTCLSLPKASCESKEDSAQFLTGRLAGKERERKKAINLKSWLLGRECGGLFGVPILFCIVSVSAGRPGGMWLPPLNLFLIAGWQGFEEGSYWPIQAGTAAEFCN